MNIPKHYSAPLSICEGAREPYTLATENDVLNGMSMLVMRLLSLRAQIFADVRTYWSGDTVKRVTHEDINKMTDATVWCEAGFDNFSGAGF